MKSREEQREERRQYENDVYYEVWRGGGDPDRIDYDRVSENYYSGHYPEDAANVELKKQIRQPADDSEEPQPRLPPNPT